MTHTTLPRLRVSADGHQLVTETGAPFFWLGDTAWELFHRLTREEARHYFATRQRQRFSLVQAVALAEFDGLTEPNRYGELPLFERDPARPNPAYFDTVDDYIHMAAEHDLYVGFLPTWGDKVAQGLWMSENVIFTPENALIYGRWLGRRYQHVSHIVWILGGDRPVLHDVYDDRPIWSALAAGIRESIPQALITYHPCGGHDGPNGLHDEAWLDMVMYQSGHGSGHDVPIWEWIEADYRRTPPKPMLDAEPNYEDSPVNPWPVWDAALGRFDAYDVRKQTWRGTLAGAPGVTYGHHSVWQFYSPEREPINHADYVWREALERPGANQVQHLRSLLESRPPLLRRPAQELLRSPAGEGGQHVRAARASDGSYAVVYIPCANQTVELDTACISGRQARAAWYDPRTGEYHAIGPCSTGSP
nr:glycoside hydrolase family 140 protein [Chloroflexaceae bacterium]